MDRLDWMGGNMGGEGMGLDNAQRSAVQRSSVQQQQLTRSVAAPVVDGRGRRGGAHSMDMGEGTLELRSACGLRCAALREREREAGLRCRERGVGGYLGRSDGDFHKGERRGRE